jgi:iron complex transport system substrate-binding protein
VAESPIFLVGLFYWSRLKRKRGSRDFPAVAPGHAEFKWAALTWAALVLAALAPAVRAAQDVPARVVTDETGRKVTVPAEVRRIVSIAPSITETLYALGAEERLVGDTDYCDDPPEAKTKPHVGAPLNPSLEAILALKPDLVIATRAINRRETVLALERLGVPVYATDPRSVEGTVDSIEALGELIGAGREGKTLATQLRARLDELRRRLAGRPPKRVLFVVWEDPLISVGPHTFLADALRRAGAESAVETTQDWPKLSLEEAVRLQPEALVFASAGAGAGTDDYDGLRERPGWRALEAVKRGRIVVVSDALDRPAPRMVDAIEQLARQLHPEAFSPREGAR